MANPTTYFGWVMPTSSSLVTNLPADFNTFGQGVDTSLQDLLGGTTGQVLSKTSATNMDFTWVTPTDQTPLTTKGDLFTFTTVDARLAVGSNGETLVADSSASVGLRYQEPKAGNPILNSSFQVWQRGTSISYSSNQAYSADRWNAAINANTGTISRQVTGDTTNLPNIQYCARLQRTAGQTGTSSSYLYQNFESINSIPFAGKTCTFSFYARAGANYSHTGSALSANVYSGTGTDQNVLSSYTGSTQPITGNVTLTTTWQRFTLTGTIPTNCTELATGFTFNPTGTAGANDYFEVTGVQLEVGSVATPFKTYAATIQGELAACQRYAWTIQNNFDCYYGLDFGGGAGRIGFASPTTMRTSASYTLLSGTPQVRLASLTTVNATPSLTTGSANSTSLQFAYTGGTVGTPISYVSNSSIILLSAEL